MSDNKNAIEIDDTELDAVSGGLPAVQKIRDAAARMSAADKGSADADGAPAKAGSGYAVLTVNGHVKTF